MARMRNLAFALCTFLFTSVATAQEMAASHGPGIGVEQNLGGLTGAAFVWDAGRFHIDILFGLQHFNEDGPDATVFGLGGRFFFVLHDMGSADFSLGGGVAVLQTDFGDASDTEIQLEAAAQIRVFLVPNVSLTASLGLVLLTANDLDVGGGPVLGGGSGESAIGIGGQLMGGFGLIYFFR